MTTPLHDDMGPSSRSTPATAEDMSSFDFRRARPPRRRRGGGRRTIRARSLCPMIVFAGLCLLRRSSAQQRQRQNRGLSASERFQRKLADGMTECSGCATSTLVCSGTTVMDEHCAPCATGQTWWPCNVADECYCKDLTAPDPAVLAEAAKAELSCELPLCDPGESGTKVVAFTNCRKYVACSAGVPGTVQECAPGQAYSSQISACNIVSLVSCDPDPNCPPTTGPTVSPETSASPTTEFPTGSMPPTITPEGKVSGGAAGGAASGGGVGGGGGSGNSNNVAASTTSAYPHASLHPSVLEGLYVMEAHMAANKIVLARELLTSPGGGRARGRGSANDFSYLGFRSSLRRMIAAPVMNQTFFIGQHVGGENGKAYGLVNVAAFLAMSAEDSIVHGSCDEVNTDLVGGMLPVSNACGQNGMHYQDMTCPKGEEMYDCPVDGSMRAQANPIDANARRRDGGSGGGEGDDPPPKPFYCGPTSDYDGYTGHWDYVSGKEFLHPPVKNEIGRQDIEGCCWWGRGSIQLRGTCAYGKLNYHLGKRAADEGRPAMFPDVDFCRDPQAVCSSEHHPDLKWVAGMFRWITEVQTYNRGDFNYMQRLTDFVDGGLQDWSFIHGVSGIVAQGCHEPPCVEGAEFDGSDRKATFIKTLRLLGLKVKDGTTGQGRRLGESMDGR